MGNMVFCGEWYDGIEYDGNGILNFGRTLNNFVYSFNTIDCTRLVFRGSSGSLNLQCARLAFVDREEV